MRDCFLAEGVELVVDAGYDCIQTWPFLTAFDGKIVVIFFFQAEDGIRDYKVTGVQTCALPISGSPRCCFAPCVPGSRDSSCRNSTSCTRVDLPAPETPVTAVSVPSGMRVSTPGGLCRRAPFTSSQRRAGRRADGTPMRFSPDRYCPVRVPAALTPAAGP